MTDRAPKMTRYFRYTLGIDLVETARAAAWALILAPLMLLSAPAKAQHADILHAAMTLCLDILDAGSFVPVEDLAMRDDPDCEAGDTCRLVNLPQTPSEAIRVFGALAPDGLFERVTCGMRPGAAFGPDAVGVFARFAIDHAASGQLQPLIPLGTEAESAAYLAAAPMVMTGCGQNGREFDVAFGAGAETGPTFLFAQGSRVPACDPETWGN